MKTIQTQEEYYNSKKCCPKCGLDPTCQTYVVYIFVNDGSFMDKNHVGCSCGWTGIVHELVGKEVPTQATFFDAVTALRLMIDGKAVSRRDNPLLVYKVRKGVMDTDLINGLSPLGFRRELYDHGDRGCKSEPPEVIKSIIPEWRWEKASLTSEDLLSNDWFLARL
jgi:hypothetical protein